MSLASVKEDFTLNDNEEILDPLKKYGDGAVIVTGGSFVNGLDARNLLTGIEALIGTAAHIDGFLQQCSGHRSTG